MQRTLLILCLIALSIMPVMAQDEESDFPDIIGKTLPQAEALLNGSGYSLAPIFLLTDTGTRTTENNTIDDFGIVGDGTRIQVTILREYNVELIWENSASFANQSGLRDLDGDELFTFVNLSDEELSLRNIEFYNFNSSDFDSSDWLATLPGGQCAQIWIFAENDPLQLPECAPIQGANLTNRINLAEQFWLNDESFDVLQNGIHRGTCETADGRCQLWLSPLPIAEDIAPYVYLIYNRNELLIYNNSETQWMDINNLAINNSPATLSAPQNWDAVSYIDIERLAPGQCVRFSTNTSNEAIEDCFILARQDTPATDIFWRDDFTLTDTLNGNNTLECPAASDERTICLLGR